MRRCRDTREQRGYYAPMEDYNLDVRRYVLERIGDVIDAT
jgi:hypothetical protein